MQNLSAEMGYNDRPTWILAKDKTTQNRQMGGASMPAEAESRLSKLPRSILRRKSYLGTPCWGTILTRARKGLFCSPCIHAQMTPVTAGPQQCNERQAHRKPSKTKQSKALSSKRSSRLC